MTHERERNDEPTGGPPLDDRLPQAVEVPVTERPGAPDEDVADDDLAVVATGHAQGTVATRRPRIRWGRTRS